MKTLTVTTRKGQWLETRQFPNDGVNFSSAEEREYRRNIVSKYAGNCYIFSAEPSDPVSLSPARRAASRKFAMGE